MDEALEILQKAQAEHLHNTIQLIHQAVFQKHDTTDLFIVACVAVFEARGMRIALDVLSNKVQEDKNKDHKDRVKTAGKYIKKFKALIDVDKEAI